MERALAKDRDHRFSDAAQMRRALRTVLVELPDDLEATQAMDPTQTADTNTKTLPAVGAGAAAGAVVAAGRSETAEQPVDANDDPLHYELDPDEDTEDVRPGAAAAAPAKRDKQKGGNGWILPAVLIVLLITGLGIGGVLGVQWWQNQQVEQPSMVSVPQVVGMDRTTAENTLRDAQLEPTFSTENSDSVPEKHVITMDPSAGDQVAVGSSVAVTVSDGPGTVDVPNDLVGQTLDNARNALREAGLSVGMVSTANSATVPENVVMSTDPAGGTSLDKDSPVQLQVSSGRVTVPDVVGMSRAEAESALRADNVRLNFNIAVRDSRDEATDTVLEQSAPAGSSVAQGSTVTLTIARQVTPSPTATPTPTPEPSEEPTAEPTSAEPTPSAEPESAGNGSDEQAERPTPASTRSRG